LRNKKRYVFLIHGLLSHPVLQLRMERRLRRAGFAVVNRWYPTVRKTVQEHAADFAAIVEETLADSPDAEVNFVTHSIGGLIARYLLSHFGCPNARRMVMIAPPNKGAVLADRFDGMRLYRSILGERSAVQLRTDGIHRECGVPPIEFGVIAGGRGNGRGFSPLIPGDNDGTISVENTHLEGERDFIVLPHQHTMLILRSDTIENVIHFLNHGRFIHERGCTDE